MGSSPERQTRKRAGTPAHSNTCDSAQPLSQYCLIHDARAALSNSLVTESPKLRSIVDVHLSTPELRSGAWSPVVVFYDPLSPDRSDRDLAAEHSHQTRDAARRSKNGKRGNNYRHATRMEAVEAVARDLAMLATKDAAVDAAT